MIKSQQSATSFDTRISSNHNFTDSSHSHNTPTVLSHNRRNTLDSISEIHPPLSEDSMECCTTQQWTNASTQTDSCFCTCTSSAPAAALLSIIPEEDDNYSKQKESLPLSTHPKAVGQCWEYEDSEIGYTSLSDEEIMSLIKGKQIRLYELEKAVKDPFRSVVIRRKFILKLLASEDIMNGLPFKDYDYRTILGKCCENVIGYAPVPVGMAGPLLVNGKEYYVPMATTEGALVASVNRGSSALSRCGGVSSIVYDDGMTRGAVIKLPSAHGACDIKAWLDDQDNFETLQIVFNSTSSYGRLKSVYSAIAGRHLFIRFKAETRDAMGMNMLSKSVEKCLYHLKELFPDVNIISLSGNYCTDKKPSAINWIKGRGKSVVCDAIIPTDVVKKVLRTNVDSLIETNTSKTRGSAMAGSIGGFNAHAANVVAAIFIATGQVRLLGVSLIEYNGTLFGLPLYKDVAQVVCSSNCITILEREGPNLYISCTMPSLEVGTVGGGTGLPAQSSCLKLLGVNGPSSDVPGDNPKELARIICSAVLAGELSLLSELTSGNLVKCHMIMNRSH